MFQVPDQELRDWAQRKEAIVAIEGSDGYKLILARIKQERDDAEAKLLNTWRWNWFRILRLLIQRDTAQSYLNYIEGVKRIGAEAENKLLRTNPNFRKEEGRASFVHS